MKSHTTVLSLLVFALSALLLGAVGSAQASFPGPNGQIAFVRAGDIYTINPDGTRERLVAQRMDPDWSPNASKIAFVRTGDIYTINPNGTGITRLTYDGRWEDPAWSPAGTQIAATYRWGKTDIRIINVATRAVTRFADDLFDSEQEPSWSPDGSKIAFSYSSSYPYSHPLHFVGLVVWQLNADGDEGKLRVASDSKYGGTAVPDWSPDGQYLAYTTNGILLVKADGSGWPRALLKSNNSGTYHPSWSPDGTKITFTRSGTEIYIAGSGGGGETHVADGHDPDWGVSCSSLSVCVPKG